MSMLPATRPLNAAYVGYKHPPLSWLLLGASLLFVTASLWPLQQSWHSKVTAQAQQSEFHRNSKRHADELRRMKAAGSSAHAQEREKSKLQMLEFVHFSWDGVFDALEVATDAVRSGVSIVSLAPTKVQPHSVQLSITALASNAPIMLTYLGALQSDPRVLQVELASQQSDDKGGPGVVRFQMNVVLDPKIQKEHPARTGQVSNAAPIPENGAKPSLPPMTRHVDPILPPSILQGARKP